MYKPSKTPMEQYLRKVIEKVTGVEKSDRGRTVLTQSVASVLEDFAYKVNFLSDISCI